MVELAGDADLLPLAQVLAAVLGRVAENRDVEEVGVVLPLVADLLAVVDGDAQLADDGPARRSLDLRVGGQISDDANAVDGDRLLDPRDPAPAKVAPPPRRGLRGRW